LGELILINSKTGMNRLGDSKALLSQVALMDHQKLEVKEKRGFQVKKKTRYEKGG
jgi:hypothetical protein